MMCRTNQDPEPKIHHALAICSGDCNDIVWDDEEYLRIVGTPDKYIHRSCLLSILAARIEENPHA